MHQTEERQKTVMTDLRLITSEAPTNMSMKKIITLAIYLAVSFAARQVLAEEARPTELSVRTADIRQIKFETASGGLMSIQPPS